MCDLSVSCHLTWLLSLSVSVWGGWQKPNTEGKNPNKLSYTIWYDTKMLSCMPMRYKRKRENENPMRVWYKI